MKLMHALTIATMTLVSSAAFAANIEVSCFKGLTWASTATPLVKFEVADTASARLVSDVTEQRASNDSETLPAFLVSQYKYQPLELLVEMDDGSADGNMVAQLQAIFIGKKSGERARYLGAYKRSDVGRQMSAVVTCVAK